LEHSNFFLFWIILAIFFFISEVLISFKVFFYLGISSLIIALLTYLGKMGNLIQSGLILIILGSFFLWIFQDGKKQN